MAIRYPTYPDLKDKVAVVTGGSHGIGAEICRALAANGAKVVVNGRDPAAIAAVVESITESGGQATGVVADVTDFSAIEHLREQTEQVFGPTDALIACAGGGIVRPGPTVNVTLEEWHSVVDGNLTATFLTLKSFLPGMIARRQGAIVTLSSTAARLPSRAPAPYSAAKAGIIMLTRHIANEVGKDAIRVNCISPSSILTERTQNHMTPEQQEQVAGIHPLGRLGMPADVASAALFLVSESASWLTGVTLDVAGGRVML